MLRLLVALALCAALSASPVSAQGDYPGKVIRMIVGFAAGGGNDIFARLVAHEARRADRLDRDHREQARRRRPARGRLRREGGARRLHRSGRRKRRDGDRADHLQDRLRHAEELRAGDHDRRLPADPGGASGPSGQDREGAGGVDQGQSRQGELFDFVAGLHAADRAVQAAHRREGRRHSVQEQRRDAARRRVRQRRDGGHRSAADHRAGAGRQAARARRDRCEAHARTARRADAWRKPACQMSWSDCGAASSCRPARRSRSSTSSPTNCAT